MFNSREMLDLVAHHQQEIRDQVAYDRFAASLVPEAHPRHAIFLAKLGATLIRIGEALQHRYAYICETVSTSQEPPLVEDGVRLRA